MWSTLDGHQFICLETFRKSGEGVRTPVGFVIEDDLLYVRTELKSGKVKRIRNNNHVRIAPSTGSGKPLGDWIEGTATFVDEAESLRLRKKVLTRYKIGYIVEFTNMIRGIFGEATVWITLKIVHN